MNQNYDPQELTRYLLGTLGESEGQRFDELSVTDERFSNALAAAEMELVDSFVQGELTGPTVYQFRKHYLASPLRRERVEFARALQNWGEKAVLAEATESSTTTLAPAKGPGWRSKFSLFGGSHLVPRWGLAAVAAVLLMAGGWLVFENLRTRQQLSQTQMNQPPSAQNQQVSQAEGKDDRSDNSKSEPVVAQSSQEVKDSNVSVNQGSKPGAAETQTGAKQSSGSGRLIIASFLLRPQMRGISQIPTVSIPVEKTHAEMTLALEPGNYKTYRVALVDVRNRTLWRSGILQRKASGEGETVSVRLGTSLLKPQNVYTLRLSGVSAAGRAEIVGDYPFKVVK